MSLNLHYVHVFECVWILTNIWDVERKPVEECVADQLGEQQTERELHHPLCETPNDMNVTRGRGDSIPYSWTTLSVVSNVSYSDTNMRNIVGTVQNDGLVSASTQVFGSSQYYNINSNYN